MTFLKNIKITRKHIIYIVILAISMFVVSKAASYFGYNTTPSVDFRFYYHTEVNEPLKQGDYILFKFPENQLYKSDIPVVKRIACISGQRLLIYRYTDEVLYTCEGKVIGQVSRFNRPNGEPLKIFSYEGLIPKGQYFVVGDTEDSFDSKYWGFVPEENILRIVHPIAFSDYIFTPAYAEDFYAIRDKGWYKYEIEPVKPDNETIFDNKTISKLPKPIVPSIEELSTMPTEDFAELFKKVQSYAMTYRTMENFDMFAKMRSVMTARAMEFANVATLWAQLNPEDTTESWFPTSGFGQDAYRTQAGQMRMNYIQENKDDYGLMYFYRDDCPYCQKQAPLIKYFEDATGWKVKRVNVEEIPESMLRFNIQTVPTIILVERETKRFLPLSSGLMTYEEIEERLYRTIKYLKGETDEKNFSNPIRPDNFVNR